MAHADEAVDRDDETVEVYVRLPHGLVAADGSRGLRCRGATAREALGDAVTRDDRLAPHLYRADGGLRVDVVLNGWSITVGRGLDTRLADGDRVALMPRVLAHVRESAGATQTSSPGHHDRACPPGFRAVDSDPLGSTSAVGVPPNPRVSAAPPEGGRAPTPARPSAQRPHPSPEVMTG